MEELSENSSVENSPPSIVYVYFKGKSFSCTECSKSFAHTRSLKRHFRVHTQEKPYTCDICMKSFSVKYYLIQHMRIHTNEKPFLCPECGKAFRQKYHVILHMRVHTKEKPFLCTECGKDFRQKSKLTVHLRMHMNEKPFLCENSGKIFNATHNKCSKDAELSDASKVVVESDETSTICVQALKHDPGISADLFSSNQEEEDGAVSLLKTEVEDEFFSIKEEMVLPEEENDEGNGRVNFLEVTGDTERRNNCKSLIPGPIMLDLHLVKIEK